ncbi:MAG: hypothetical protein AAF203_00725 [Pseudomonadota bacterium]
MPPINGFAIGFSLFFILFGPALGFLIPWFRDQQFKKLSPEIKEPRQRALPRKSSLLQFFIYLFISIFLIVPIVIFAFEWNKAWTVWTKGSSAQAKVVATDLYMTKRSKPARYYKTTVRWTNGKENRYYFKERFADGETITIYWHKKYPKAIFSNSAKDWQDFYIATTVSIGLIFVMILIWLPFLRTFQIGETRKLKGVVKSQIKKHIKGSFVSYTLIEVPDPRNGKTLWVEAEIYSQKRHLEEGEEIKVLQSVNSDLIGVPDQIKSALWNSG